MKRLTFSIATAILLSTTSASAGIPVIDVASIAQAVTNYSQMIKDYTLQLQQYEQMYSQLQQQLLMVEMQQRNLKRLTNYDFRDTRSILLNTRQIMTRVQTISYDAEGVARSFEKTYGDFEKYNNMLNEAQNEEEKAELFSNKYKEIAMINQNTIDGTLQKLEARYEELDNETYELTTLKNRSSNSVGQLEALQAIGDLIAYNVEETRKLRFLMMDQTNAMLNYYASLNNKEILNQAKTKNFSKNNLDESPYTKGKDVDMRQFLGSNRKSK